MDNWTNKGIAVVTARSKEDPIYQSLLEQCIVAEEACLAVLGNLTPQERACIEQYMTLCDELQYRMTQLAYSCNEK